MQWADVLADPCLQDLPYKIELDQYGRIVMSPASNEHAGVQGTLAGLLRDWLPGGRVFTECSVATAAGVRVPDVAWASSDFVRRFGRETPFPQAPDLCVVVLSPSNSAPAMAEKVALFLGAGAREVWLVREDGTLVFHGAEGQRSASIFTGVPARIAV